MGIQIEDGTGSGNSVRVDSNNRIETFAVVRPEDAQINRIEGKVWSLPFKDITNTGADDYICYIKNTGVRSLIVTDFRFSGSAATQIEINQVEGTAGGSLTAIVPISRNLGSSSLPETTAQTSADITGLTKIGTIFFMEIEAANKLSHLSTSSRIVIPKNSAIAILVETTSITIDGIISLQEDIF